MRRHEVGSQATGERATGLTEVDRPPDTSVPSVGRVVIRERIRSATLWTPEDSNAEKVRRDQGLPNQGGGGTSAATSNAHIDPSRLVYCINYTPEVETPTVNARPRPEKSVKSPGYQNIQEERPFITGAKWQ